jgi:biotin carboxylase
MSLIAARLNDLIHEAKDHINLDRVEEIAAVLRSTGHYGSEAAEVAAAVLAANFVLSGPDADNARHLSGYGRN